MSFAALLWKDARVEWRSKDVLAAGLVLVALFFILNLFTRLDLAAAPVEATVAVWTPVLYATTMMVGRAFASEHDAGTLDRLRLAPVDLGLHGVSRTLLNILLGLLVASLAVALLHLGWGVPISAPLVASLALGVLGLAIVGTLAGALASQARAREVLLPILVVPVVAPLVHAGTAATLAAIEGTPDRAAFLLMAGYDLMAAGIAWVLWPVALEVE